MPRPVTLDGILITAASVFAFLQVCFGSDESYKYVNPYVLYWLKIISGAITVGCTSLKAYRSTAYSDFKKEQKESDLGNTEIIPKPKE